MDTLDQQLLGLLRADARATVATLAKKLDVSRGTINNRIARMEDEGIIVGYTVRLRPESQPDQIGAWMNIAVDGNETRRVVSILLGTPPSSPCTTPTAAGTCWPNCASPTSRKCPASWTASVSSRPSPPRKPAST